MDITVWMAVILGIFLFFLGSSVFSFLNVVIFRVPRKEEFIKTRSHCPGCGRTLTPLELIPVVSYICLGGKCRTCGSKIGLRDVLVELLGSGLCILSFWYYFQAPVESLAAGLLGDFYGRFLAALTAFAFFSVLTVITFIDIDTMEILPGTVIAVAVLAVISYFTMPPVSILSRIIGALCVSLPMFLLTLVINGAFGGGDIKLMAAAGLFLGWKTTLVSTLLAFVFGALWAVWLLLSKKKGRKDHFAFGPFLCMGMAVGLLYGDAVIQWYLGFLR